MIDSRMTKLPSDTPINGKGSLLPVGDNAKDLLSLGGKSILELLKFCAGQSIGPAGSAVVGIGGALLGYVTKKYERRVEAFSKETLNASPQVQTLFASENPPEPLLATFVSIFESCLRDDEDEKVTYYAAFVVGMAEAHIAGALPHLRKVAMLGAIRALRAHDLLLFSTLSIAEPFHDRRLSMRELTSYVRAEMKQVQPDFEMADQAFAQLLSHGLIQVAPEDSSAVLTMPTAYGLTVFGKAFWGVLKEGVERSLCLDRKPKLQP